MDLDSMTDDEIEEAFPHGRCDLCETALELHADGEFCPVCEPRCMLEESPVRASFNIALPANRGTPGVVTWAGWSAFEPAPPTAWRAR